MAEADAVVIGGGAAGIAAARRLHDAGRDVLLVEAKDRLGGRAHTVEHGGFPLDHGCGWLHSAKRNPWTMIAEASGFTVDRTSPRWGEQWRNLGFPAEDQQAFGEAWDRWEERARAALGGPDRPLADFVAHDERWRPMLDAISSYANGAPLAQVSLHDWVAYEDASTEDNWSVREGYGALISSHAVGVPVRLSTPVTRVDHRGPQVRVDTPAGVIETNHVVVAVPTPVLATGALRFDPALPAKQEAADALPLGLADKVLLSVDGPIWPHDRHLIGSPFSACTAAHRLSPFGWPVIECFLGGDCAEQLEDGDAAVSFVLDELVSLLGSEWRQRLTPMAATRWRAEPHILGSYSHARVGQAGARATLAEPVDDRIFFAGEACSAHDFSTAHGAYATGLAAAEAILSRGSITA